VTDAAVEIDRLSKRYGAVLALTDLTLRVEPGDERQIAFEVHSILMSAHALFQITQDPAVFTNARTAIGRLVG